VLATLELEATGPGARPADAAEAGEAADSLRAALAHLPPDQRRAIVLAALCGRTAKEVSEVEGIPLGTAKTRIRSAMLKLRQALDPTRRLAPEEVVDP
jgi:RNA polymerase sigma-70 factor (ECF subfamily)